MADRKGVEIPHGWAVDSKGLVRRLIIQISEAKLSVNILYRYLRYFKLEFELDEIFMVTFVKLCCSLYQNYLLL